MPGTLAVRQPENEARRVNVAAPNKLVDAGFDRESFSWAPVQMGQADEVIGLTKSVYPCSSCRPMV
jgi:hypothetical protein